MEKTASKSEIQQIIADNSDYTFFPWNFQKGWTPVTVAHASGVYLYDYNGKRYIDFSSGLFNVNIGHGQQRVTAAVAKQMQEVAYVVPEQVTRIRGELGKKLADISPGNLKKTLFTVCGASAIENAIKLARIYTGKYKIIGRYRAYHGATYATMSVGGDSSKLAHDAHQAPGFVHVEDPYCYRCPFGQEAGSCQQQCVAHVERVIEFEGPQNIAAIIMEGESGASGCIKYPPGYLLKIRELCNKHNILLIVDEVLSGFGRTGKWFATELHGVVPDIMATSKGITSAYLPLGAITVSEPIAAFFDDKFFPLGLTNVAHPVTCAAALEVLKIYEDDHLIENAAAMGDYILQRVKEMQQHHPCIGDIRFTGLLGCLELVKNRETKAPMAPYDENPEGMKVMIQLGNKLKELGMSTFLRWNFLFIAPPLCITKEEADEGLAIIDEALFLADEYTS
ncbi:aminotransferase class III-fold pyridoxal phosphate-dependent enzyme [Chitinophaga sp. Mgbs1]|uniref:Aminotransferase class III-fold pyridoxal phosphate-dependent enzyme n=1 Tax=Chitinophaga solisilvae TaxID=1233460 RepID=A0A9Q5D671_9BACT|nr:aminotransferase class III-fold pyridoxal phosphate-dependent enzyme [Chitinophaga solisilvae]